MLFQSYRVLVLVSTFKPFSFLLFKPYLTTLYLFRSFLWLLLCREEGSTTSRYRLGGYQYLQRGYIVLCISENKTIFINIIIIVIIIVMKSGAQLLGLAKSIYYWDVVLIFYFEASSSYFTLRLCPHISFWGFVLIFHIEALSSYFILRLCPHIVLRLRPHILYWGFVLIAELHPRAKRACGWSPIGKEMW